MALSVEQWSEIQITIAHQVHHMKPVDLVPGRDVFFIGEEDGSLTVVTADRVTNVRYDAGADHYSVSYKAGAHDAPEALHGVYFDQLGELCFGSDAEPYTLPIVAISTDDGESWEVIA